MNSFFIRVSLTQRYIMTEADIRQMENEVFTKLVIDTLKQQRADGKTEFLLDKYEIDKTVQERLRKLLSEK